MKWIVFKDNGMNCYCVAAGAPPEHTDSGVEIISKHFDEREAKDISDALNRKIDRFDAIYNLIDVDYEAIKSFKPRKREKK